MMTFFTKRLSLWVAAAAVTSLSACDKYNHSPEPTKSYMEAKPAIYGETPDAPAKQKANTYPTNPEAAGKATELRGKMYGNANTTTTDGATQSTAAPAASPAPAATEATKPAAEAKTAEKK